MRIRSLRTVALTLTALTLLGLVTLHLATATPPLAVPENARAGTLLLHSCRFDTESGSQLADCGTLVVPENRDDPRSRLIALPVTRIRASSTDKGDPVFRLGGGPGKTNMRFPAASRLTRDHDLVLVGYRGVDGSVRLDCPEVTSALQHSRDFLTEASFTAQGAAFRACATRLTRSGVDLKGYSVVEQADDLESARLALGYPRIDLLSDSGGTRVAMIYSWRHPATLHRSLMVGANPPGHYGWNAPTTDEQIARYSSYCSADPSCSARTKDLAATVHRTAAATPGRWLFLPISSGDVAVATFEGLSDSAPSATPITSPMTLGAWLSASEGDASGLWFQSVAARLLLPGAFTWGESAAVASADAGSARHSATPAGRSPISTAGERFQWAGGQLAGAWPSTHDPRYDDVQTSTAETLVVDGSLDVMTQPQVATKELLPHLPNGHQVVLPGFAHTGDFWGYQPEANRRLVTTFFDTGKVDTSLYRPHRLDLSPGLTQEALGKVLAGVVIGLALFTVLSLAALARRVHRRGRLGRRAAAVVRSVHALVLGLGGWCLGVLVALVALPAAALAGRTLVAVAVGVPVGLGVYLGWTDRLARTGGLVAASAGALAGAWLGFATVSGLLAVVTATAGAVAGGNLALLVLDIVRDPKRPAVPVPPAQRPAPVAVRLSPAYLAATALDDRLRN